MDETLSTIIAIFLAAILMFIFPVSTIADLNDDTSQMYVKTTLDNFVNKVISKGKITKDDYDELEATLLATNNSYEINMVVSIADENTRRNPGDENKPTTYYSIYTTQIKEKLDGDAKAYYLKEGDFIKVSVQNTNTTISQMLKNVLYGLTGNDNYVIAASSSGVVVATGY